MLSTNVTSTDGVVVSSVDYTASISIKRDILNALTAIRKNKLILSCQIDGHEIWGNLKQFDSTIDDKDRKEIPSGDFDEFRSDIQRIIIKSSGTIVFKAYGKWSDDYLSFEID